jgi:RimJ/RimL family protein N-acetyltransferase
MKNTGLLNLEKLVGPNITLTPLTVKDLEPLFKALMSNTTWMVAERGIKDEKAFEKYIKSFLERQEKGEGLTLVARTNKSCEITSMSTFWNFSPTRTKIEIGFTWVADKWMGTFVNTEQKFLMLNYAFEKLNVRRVEFSVDPKNEKSNKAMKRIGASFEGTLRKWRFLSENDKGDRNIYSVIDDEWAEIKVRLENNLKSRI